MISPASKVNENRDVFYCCPGKVRYMQWVLKQRRSAVSVYDCVTVDQRMWMWWLNKFLGWMYFELDIEKHWWLPSVSMLNVSLSPCQPILVSPFLSLSSSVCVCETDCFAVGCAIETHARAIAANISPPFDALMEAVELDWHNYTGSYRRKCNHRCRG